ncbi:phosphoribosylpyrophosphate synthetase [Bradyrhizobium sp. UFLA03-84]|uniref:ribose-phosphate diphosphokinase n=1 Tax=Bradyrhizobium sp. UFLA03-84 TaxID=418599 RepID=UPI000BAE4602|nr:ribose-phosphate diphosphokinase [Bradyrhizobium sp. UFLA03-84]PAY10607.1 phosphoribosylpyrophosphate synthetase [Bradyrhizobium sp. UFLA03-84]
MMGAVIQWMPTSAGIGRALAEQLDAPGHEIALHRFPDGELRVTVGPAAPTTVICCSLNDPNEKLIALLFAAEALRRGGAHRLVLVAPYLGYMRQDAAFHAGEAISQRAIGDLLAKTFDRVVTVEAHLHRTATLSQVFPGLETDNLSAASAIESMLRAHTLDSTTLVVGPDTESLPWVSGLADRLGLAFAVGEKVRFGDRSVQIVFSDAARLWHRPVVLVDDIVSSGGTLFICAEALASSGVSSIDAVVVHALFPPELLNEFSRAGIRSLRSTNSVPHPTNGIALDRILADALRREVVVTSIAENGA